MYTLVNKYGNAQVKTESAVKRDALMALGYREVEPHEDKQEPPKAPKNKRKNAAAAANAEEE